MSRSTSVAIFVVFALAACAYFAFLRKHCSPYAGGSDSSGYLNIARLLANGELITPTPHIEGLAPPAWNYDYHRPLGFEIDRNTGALVPTYPIGYPLHLLLASFFIELDYAAILANLSLAAAAAALMFALGRQFGLPRPWALSAVVLLCACPLFNTMAVQPMSDLAATVWVLAAIWFALRARTDSRWAIAGGLAFSIAVLVRPSNIVVLLPAAIALGPRLHPWLALIAAGIPGALFLAWYNHTLYGNPLSTGYVGVDELFRLDHAPHNARHIVIWTFLLVSPPVALAAIALPSLRRSHPLFVRIAACWCAAFASFYMFYFHTGERWEYLRFLLPIFPAIILAAVLVVHRWTTAPQPPTIWRRSLPIAALAAALFWDIGLSQHLKLAYIKSSEKSYEASSRWMTAHAPANAIVLQMQLSGAFTYYTDFTIVRYDFLDAATTWPRLKQAARAAHRPIYATLFDFEEDSAFHNLPGNWERIARIRQTNVWKLSDTNAP